MDTRGWEVGTLNKLVKIKQGKYRKHVLPHRDGNHEIKFFGGGRVRGYVAEYDFSHPVTFITCRGSGCGSIQKALTPSAFSNSVIALQELKNISVFSFIYNCSLLTDFSPFVTGSAQPQITIGNISKCQSIIPNFKIQHSFEKITKFLYKKILTNNNETQTLTKLRDTLLPKLISGKIRV